MKMLRLATLMFAFVSPAYAAVDIQTVTSPGGIHAWLIEDHNIPFMSLEINFRGGTSLDAPGKRGAVNLMTALIEEGTGDLDSQGFAKARDSLAASYGFEAGIDGVSVTAQFLTENRDQAVDLLHLALTAPRFDQDAIDRVRGQVLANIRSDAKDPSAIAGRQLKELAYGDHPYATSGDGTEDSVNALTRDDLVAAHKATLARDRIYVAASGDISAQELGVLLDRLLGDLPETGAALPERAPNNLKGGVTVIDFPGPQSTVLFAEAGIRTDDPDFIAASLLNEVLGGGRFTARLMTEVREKRGLTYGIGTYLVAFDYSEGIMGQFSAANANVAPAIDVIRTEWARIAKEGVSDKELADAKTYSTGSYPLRFEGNARIASILVGMQTIGLSADYPATRNDRVNAVTMDDIRRVAQRLLKADDLRFIVVGQPEGVQSTP